MEIKKTMYCSCAMYLLCHRTVRKWLSCLLLLLAYMNYAQTVDIEALTKSKPVKVQGTLSTSAVYYNSNQNSSRAPLTYFAQGVLNIAVYDFAIPITYSYSKQGDNLGYQLPFNLNRLSLHPKYKWITGHLGSVSLAFSPYTLNGHQFTGGGLELAPKTPFKLALMSGELLKATNDDLDPRTVPAFRRFGYGLKAEYMKDKWAVGMTAFYAKDAINSIDSIPEVKNVLPQENIAVSFNTKLKLNKYWSIDAEYATTSITKDLRSTETSESTGGLGRFFLKERTSTAAFDALRAALEYTAGAVKIGLGYERIDPGYETLGAYFFNNDFENITLNAANTFFKDKLTLDLNVGLQRDDLNKAKANSTSRTIGAVNATWLLNKKTTVTGSYSNLSSFTNVKPNQFELINDSDLTDTAVENLDYRQLTQNATFNVNYILSEAKAKPQSLYFNYSLNDVANEQGGVVRLGDASTFHNASLGHTVNFTSVDLALNSALNTTYNTIGREDAVTWGPTLSLSKPFINKTLNTQCAIAYNQTRNTAGVSKVLNLRLSGSYSIKKVHNFNISAAQLMRSAQTTEQLREFTATFGYNYAFGLKKPKIKFPEWKRKYSDTVKVDYKAYHYLDTPKNITPQLLSINTEAAYTFLQQKNKVKLLRLEKQLISAENEDKRVYKTVALAYLKCLDDYVNFEKKYYDLVFKSFVKLKQEAEALTETYKTELIALSNPSKKSARQEVLIAKAQKRLDAHLDLVYTLRAWDIINKDSIKNPNSQVKTLMKRYLKVCFDKFDNGESDAAIITFLEIRWASHFHKQIREKTP